MKDEAILGMTCGYLLSRYPGSYRRFGHGSKEATHHALGTALGVPPNSIRNWRAEFDPIHGNGLKGWGRAGCIALKLTKACNAFSSVTDPVQLLSAISVWLHEGVHTTQDGGGTMGMVGTCQYFCALFEEALQEVEACIIELDSVCIIEEYLNEGDPNSAARVADRAASIKHACQYGEYNLARMELAATTAANEECGEQKVADMVTKYDDLQAQLMAAKARAQAWEG